MDDDNIDDDKQKQQKAKVGDENKNNDTNTPTSSSPLRPEIFRSEDPNTSGFGADLYSSNSSSSTDASVNFMFEPRWFVEIPSTQQKTTPGSRFPHTVYRVKVGYGSATWVVERRFKEFFALHARLQSQYPESELPLFPNRSIKFMQDPEYIRLRQETLSAFFQQLPQTMYNSPYVLNFLDAYYQLHQLGIKIPGPPADTSTTVSTPSYTSLSTNSLDGSLSISGIPKSHSEFLEVCPNIYCNVSTIDYHGIDLPHRMMVIQLPKSTTTTTTTATTSTNTSSSGSSSATSTSAKFDLVLYGPSPLDSATKMGLAKLGDVVHVIVPTKLHETHLQTYINEYKDATYYFPAGMKVPLVAKFSRTKTIEPDAKPFSQCLNNMTAEIPWLSELDGILTYKENSSSFQEIILFHKKTSTIMVSEFVEHLPQNFFEIDSAGINGWAVGIFSDAKGEPFIGAEHAMYTTSPEALQRLSDEITKWNAARIIMSHGGVLDGAAAVKTLIVDAVNKAIAKLKERWGVTSALLSVVGKFT